jgi:hypothetical protein
LCDITHGRVWQRSEWKTCRTSLAVPFDTYHRDQQPEGLAAATGGEVPVVVAETHGGYVAHPISKGFEDTWLVGYRPCTQASPVRLSDSDADLAS